MQSVLAVNTLQRLHNVDQQQLGAAQLKDQAIAVVALEPACCLPASKCSRISQRVDNHAKSH